MSRSTCHTVLQFNAVRRLLSLLLSLALALSVPFLAVADEADGPSLTPIDLGTLNPRFDQSAVTDISGDIVVGWSVVGLFPPVYDEEFGTSYRPPKKRAFAYDLGAEYPKMIDLGTLGGETSSAVAVDGDIVIGVSSTAEGHPHAFAYDLDADSPSMIDLGTLGGHSSRATAVDGHLVVGHSWVEGDDHAFAYDLSAPSPRMIDLGTPGRDSYATAVDGGVVVGHDGTGGAWAYDLAAPDPFMRDLGNLGGNGPTRAQAISGRLVVGYSWAASPDQPSYGGPRAFVYDLTDPESGMQDLGAGAGHPRSSAVDVEGDVVVGTSSEFFENEGNVFVYRLGEDDAHAPSPIRLEEWRNVLDVDASGVVTGVFELPGSNEPHVFTYDLRADEPASRHLGSLGERGGAVAVDNGVLAGNFDGHAAVWLLDETVRLELASTRVPESEGTLSVRVLRTGTLEGTMAVDYEISGGTARANADFKPAGGTLVFNPGEAEKSFEVSILNDAQAEREETVRVRLKNAPDGVRIMTPTVRTIAIQASDQRPDALLSRARRSGYVGDGVYNTTARRQRLVANVRPGGSISHFVRIQNDGTARTTFTVRQATNPQGVRVAYFSGGRKVSRAMVSRTGWRVAVRPGHSRAVRMYAKVGRTARTGSVERIKVAVQWRGDRTLTDAVESVLNVIR